MCFRPFLTPIRAVTPIEIFITTVVAITVDEGGIFRIRGARGGCALLPELLLGRGLFFWAVRASKAREERERNYYA